MACSSDRFGWIDHAERSLYDLARQLRRVPLRESTKHLHVRALELKREVRRWPSSPPDARHANATLEEIERLARELRQW